MFDKFSRLVRLLCPFALAAALHASAAPVSKEYQLKAAFLYNFTKFVEWQVAPAAGDDRPIVIGVLGQDPFGGLLETVVQGRKVNGREVVIARPASAAEAASVHVLFVAAGEEKRFKHMLDLVETAGVLTVGESGEFASLGGIITFVPEADKIRFEIDADAAARSRIKISAQLQKLARAVRRSAPSS